MFSTKTAKRLNQLCEFCIKGHAYKSKKNLACAGDVQRVGAQNARKICGLYKHMIVHSVDSCFVDHVMQSSALERSFLKLKFNYEIIITIAYYFLNS